MSKKQFLRVLEGRTELRRKFSIPGSDRNDLEAQRTFCLRDKTLLNLIK